MKIIHLALPDSLHAWLKARAANEHRTIKGEVLKMIEDKKKEYENG